MVALPATGREDLAGASGSTGGRCGRTRSPRLGISPVRRRMRMRRSLRVAIAVLALAATAAPADSPTAALRSAVDAVLKILEDPALRGDARVKERRLALSRVAEQAFDFPEIARRVLGRYWRERTAGEREEFTTLFRELLERTYSSLLDRFGGEKVVYLDESVDGDFARVRTPEPFGDAGRAGGGRLFMVHKHAARRLHYDLRLEMGGVLASWAVPKGPPVHPRDKRLAVHVEDHPLEYGDYEGVIPEGNYGAGPSIVWDRGLYRLVDGVEPLEAVRRGKLDLAFSGFKMRGRYALVRTARGERDWLLIKKADAAVSEVELTERYPESVLSGLTVEELGEGGSRRDRVRAWLGAARAPRGTVTPARQGFELATLVERPPEGRGWIYEIKYDGVRLLEARRGRTVELYGRSGQPTP